MIVHKNCNIFTLILFSDAKVTCTKDEIHICIYSSVLDKKCKQLGF